MDFDAILGGSEKRYLASGYKNVRYSVVLEQPLPYGDIGARTLPKTAATVEYPQSWSTKPGGEVEPHLSSFDAVVLGLGLSNLSCGPLNPQDGQASPQELSRLKVRAGAKPVSVRSKVAASWTEAKEQGELHISAKFGSMSVDVWLREGRADCAESDGSGQSPRLQAGAYPVPRPELDFESKVLHLDTDLRQMVSTHAELHGPENGLPLIFSRPGCQVTYLDFLRLSAQAAQVLIYSVDHTERSAKTNLWMRSATFYPLNQTSGTSQEHILRSQIVDAKTLALRDAKYRVFQLHFELDDTMGCDASLTYVSNT